MSRKGPGILHCTPSQATAELVVCHPAALPNKFTRRWVLLQDCTPARAADAPQHLSHGTRHLQRGSSLVPQVSCPCLQDSLDEIARQTARDLFKPLRVHFIGEDGIDAGGVKKEFFQLLVTELLNPDYGMLMYQSVSPGSTEPY